MKMNEIRSKAKELGLTIRVGMTKVDAVRAIQAAEGHDQCYGRGLAESCGQEDCCFRSDCLKIS
ncbi:MAG TPA: SAP domain-containing protein [Thermodesulfobacteriaceae bacterium]|nr:SAP domain-containing protein [Thermodesulfobacteriaceae bacterium]